MTVTDAIAKMKDPVTDAYSWGHQYVCGILLFRQHMLLFSIRLYVKKERGVALGLSFHKITELAAHRIRSFKAPAGVKVMVLFDADHLSHTVVKACRAQHLHVASTRKSYRRLFKRGWKLKAGRYGKNLLRRCATEPLVTAKPHGSIRYRDIGAEGLEVSTLSRLHVLFSRKGAADRGWPPALCGLRVDPHSLVAESRCRDICLTCMETFPRGEGVR